MQKINFKNVLNKSGVYFFRDKHGRILYIGKAVNLKNRLANYFKSQFGGRTARLMQVAAKVSWQETDSEIEALILESQLIKKYRPPFNIMLRDDKQYFYVGFTKEEFPKIILTHQILDTRYKILNTEFVGPFTDGSALKTTFHLLRRIFPYCTCKQKHNNYCLNYHIGKCLGFCCFKQQNPNYQPSTNNKQQKDEYWKNIKVIKDILSGKRVTLIKKLKKEMADLGKTGKFEEAFELRDKIEKLEKVFENAQIIQNTKYKILNTKNEQKDTNLLVELQNVLDLPCPPKRIEGYDISNIQGQFATGAMVVFINGQPDKNQYRKFKIRFGNSPNDTAMLKEILTRRFNHPEWLWPDLIIVDGGRAQLNAAIAASSLQLTASGKKLSIIALTKNQRHRGSHIYLWSSYLWSSQDSRLKEVAMPLKKLPERVRNLILHVNAEAHRFAIGYHRKLHGRLN